MMHIGILSWQICGQIGGREMTYFAKKSYVFSQNVCIYRIIDFTANFWHFHLSNSAISTSAEQTSCCTESQNKLNRFSDKTCVVQKDDKLLQNFTSSRKFCDQTMRQIIAWILLQIFSLQQTSNSDRRKGRDRQIASEMWLGYLCL